MPHETISSTDRIYSCYESANQYQVTAVHQGFMALCSSLWSLQRDAGDDNDLPIWTDLLSPVKGFVYRHLAAPIPFDDPGSTDLFDKFKSQNQTSNATLPVYFERLAALEESFEELVQSPENPLAELCAELLGTFDVDKKPVGLVVCRLGFTAHLASVVDNSQNPGGWSPEDFIVLSPEQLKGADCYEKLVVFGHQNLYRHSQHVFTAQRTTDQYQLGFNWTASPPRLSSGFIDPQNVERAMPRNRGEVFSRPPVQVASNPVHVGAEPLEIDEIIPTVDINKILGRLSRNSDGLGLADHSGLVEARFIELDDDHGVFLEVRGESGEGSDHKYHVIDISPGSSPGVLNITVEDLEPGMFLVLRTAGGGGDYIEFVADQFLGEYAGFCRDSQNDWKSQLSREIYSKGAEQVAAELQSKGCRVANLANLRHWVSSRSIRLRDESDFMVLIDYLGLIDSFDRIHLNTHLIWGAHVKAGHSIRKSLESQIQGMNPKEFATLTRKDFTLAENDGGSLTAIRIRVVHEDVLVVQASHTQHLEPLG